MFKSLLIGLLTSLSLSTCAHGTNTVPVNVLMLEDGMTSPKAEIKDLAWMEGRWISEPTEESFGGGAEHVILGPHDGQMPGLVRVYHKDQTYMLFELSSFMEVDGTLTYRNRHFAPDLVAWQPQEDYVDRRLVAIDETTAYFHGITFTDRGEDKMGVSFVLTDDDGQTTKYNVDYRKQP